MMASSANRWQRYRARKRNGRVLLEIEVDEVAVEQLLYHHGELPPDGAHDHAELTNALTKLLDRLIDADAKEHLR